MRTAITLALAVIWSLAAPVAAQENPIAPRPDSPPMPREMDPEPAGFVEEPAVVERSAAFMDRHFANGDLSNGFYVNSFDMIPGAGWISAGPGYRYWFMQDQLFVDGSAAISWRGYKTAQGRVELPTLLRSRLALGTAFRWQDYKRIADFGEGPATQTFDERDYHLKSTNLVGYATVRPIEPLAIDAALGWLSPSLPGRFVDEPTFLHTELAATVDTRDFPGHPTRGGVFRAATANFADRDGGAFSFRRYEAEAAQFVPVAGARVVLALHGWVVGTDTDEGGAVPFYLQPSLGGRNTLRAFDDYRFHDRHMAVVNAEARFALMTHVDLAAFVDAGNVAARFDDLNLDKRSYGAGLRLHSKRETFARLDVARGAEGWRFVFNLSDPLNLSRLTRRTASAPFVP